MLQKNSCTLLFAALFACCVKAQILHRPTGADYTHLVTYSATHFDLISFTGNQASLANLKKSGAGLFGERRYMLNELKNLTALVGLTTTSGNFGINANYMGSAEYNESKIGLAYGRSLGAQVNIGAQFNYNALQIAGYGDASTVSFELGTILHLSDKLSAGLHINNPVGGKFGKNEQEKLPGIYSFGFGYDASEIFYAGAQIVKEENQPVAVIAGVQYKPVSQLLIRTGISSGTSLFWVGIGFSYQSIRFDVTSNWHPQLGISPGLLVQVNFK